MNVIRPDRWNAGRQRPKNEKVSGIDVLARIVDSALPDPVGSGEVLRGLDPIAGVPSLDPLPDFLSIFSGKNK